MQQMLISINPLINNLTGKIKTKEILCGLSALYILLSMLKKCARIPDNYFYNYYLAFE
jgi:hypothetical protein